MKLLIVFAVVVAVAVAEPCKQSSDCMFENCDTNVSHIACHNHVCTCDANGQSGNTCSSASECSTRVKCRDRHQAHCVDGNCKCLFGLGK